MSDRDRLTEFGLIAQLAPFLADADGDVAIGHGDDVIYVGCSTITTLLAHRGLLAPRRRVSCQAAPSQLRVVTVFRSA
jgi:hypothetical protein